MFKLKDGWTKARVMEQVKKYNNGTRSYSHGDCLYLAPDDNRCAIGCFIPDGHPGLKHEGSVMNLLHVYPDLKESMPFEDIYELSLFQSIHDSSFNEDVYRNVQNFLERNGKV